MIFLRILPSDLNTLNTHNKLRVTVENEWPEHFLQLKIVLHHPSKNLRAASHNLAWYQYFMLDSIMLLASSLALVIFIQRQLFQE